MKVTAEQLKTRRALIIEGNELKGAVKDAKAAYAKACAILETTKPVDPADDATDEEIEAWALAYEIAAEEAGCYIEKNLLWEVEGKLIAWSEKVMKAYHAEDFNKVAIVFEKGPRNVTLRPKLIDLCMGLSL